LKTNEMNEIKRLGEAISACDLCIRNPRGRPLPHEPRPVAVLSETAQIAICGQAPGTRVHASGVPFTDPSGDRLRDWLGIDEKIFYDSTRIAIVPMGFCFPGLDQRGSDLPPRKECAGQWRQAVFDAMPQIKLLVAIGQYAQRWHLGSRCGRNLTETVLDWQEIVAQSASPTIMPLPHPSWRNNIWIKKNPWFSNELLPVLKKRVEQLL
jgi:uracil-DNA glycosylase